MPPGKVLYSGVGFFALPAGFAFTFGIFSKISIPFPWRLVRIGMAIVFFLGALQAFERLLRPENAHELFFAGYCLADLRGEHFSKRPQENQIHIST